MLGDVANPQLVRFIGFERVADHTMLIDVGAQVVVDRWTWLFPLAAFGFPEH